MSAQASNGDTVLYDAAGSGNLDCVKLLLEHGANSNVASYACQLPIHRAAYEGHILQVNLYFLRLCERALTTGTPSRPHTPDMTILSVQTT